MLSHVLTNYPLSSHYKTWLERELGLTPNYISVQELRQRPTSQVVKYLLRLQGGTLLLPLEDGNSAAILPILELMAALTRIKRIGIITPDKERIEFRRWQALRAIASFLSASARCVISLRRCDRELDMLSHEEIVVPKVSNERRVAYLNANLWFGVKAGGSVGHMSGVVNGFLRLGYDVDFFSAGSRLMVSPQAEYVQLEPPSGYGLPYDGNYYHFNRKVVETVEKTLEEGDYAFIYQRMSVANYTGVLVSRKHQIPLVLEYNGSEVWVASRWGRPLSHPLAAEKAENICLRHAHAIVTVSDVLREELVERGVPEERIVSYPNCVDPEIFDPERFSETDVASLRARYGLNANSVVVSFLGTFGQWHGVEVMGEAIRLLASKQREFLKKNGVHFLIIGDGMRMGALRQILSDECCEGLYTLPGLVRQEEAPLYLAAADILLSPHVRNSDGTPFFGSPTKLFEYMAMGKAIAASDLDQIGKVLQNSIRSENLPVCDLDENEDRLAVLCAPGDICQLAEAIIFLVQKKAWRRTLGENARREALSKYTWSRHVETIEDRLRALALVSSGQRRQS